MIAQVIVSKIVLVSKIIGKAIYVFSVLGAVQDCYLLHSVVICVICDPWLCWLFCGRWLGGIEVGPLIAATYRYIQMFILFIYSIVWYITTAASASLRIMVYSGSVQKYRRKYFHSAFIHFGCAGALPVDVVGPWLVGFNTCTFQKVQNTSIQFCEFSKHERMG